MAKRPSAPDDAALWRRVIETVRPAKGRRVAAMLAPAKARMSAATAITLPEPVPRYAGEARPQTLDGSWDRQLTRGGVVPDRTIDLHGDTLDRAYHRIDAELALACGRGERIILLITGKAGGVRTGGPDRARGAIRAVVGDWLAASRHAGRIAAVRPAHPRHGGAGALYVILRRR